MISINRSAPQLLRLGVRLLWQDAGGGESGFNATDSSDGVIGYEV
jgi:hypothetical protein